MKSIQTSDLVQPLRIWTDYQRTNETFFWSDTARGFWSTQNENQLGFHQSYVTVQNVCRLHEKNPQIL